MKVVSHHDNNNETIIQKVWLPIGSIYENKNDITEEIKECFYGTWERYGNGEVLVGVDESDNDFKTPDKSLGEKTHKLTIAEMPKHVHELGYDPGDLIASGRDKGEAGRGSTGGQNWETFSTGDDQPHNNIQPSRTIYRWIRVS